MSLSLGRSALAMSLVVLVGGCGGSRDATAPANVTTTVKVTSGTVVTKSTTKLTFSYEGGLLTTIAGSKSEDGVTEKWKATATYTDELLTKLSVKSGDNSAVSTYAYDGEDRLDVVRETAPGGKSTVRYTYDDEGAIDRESFEHSSGAGSETVYRYDADGLLERKESDEGTAEYTYDADRLSRFTADVGPSADFDFEYDEDDRLIEVVGQDARYSLAYDEAGLVSEIRYKLDLSSGGATSVVSSTTLIEYTDAEAVGVLFYPPVVAGEFFDSTGAFFTELHTGLSLPLGEVGAGGCYAEAVECVGSSVFGGLGGAACAKVEVCCQSAGSPCSTDGLAAEQCQAVLDAYQQLGICQ